MRTGPDRLFAGLLALSLVACAGERSDAPHVERSDLRPTFLATTPGLGGRLSPATDGDGWVTPTLPVAHRVFDRVGMRLMAPEGVRIDVEASYDGGAHFGARVRATQPWREGRRVNAHVDLPPGATHLRVRFSDVDPEALTFLALETFVHAPEPRGEPSLPSLETEGLGTSRHHLAADGVAVSRADWGARATQCSSTHSIYRMTVHHTVSANGLTDMPAELRQIQSFHMDTRGWCDVGYHFLVGQDGKVYQGRVETLLGAHVGGNNTGNGGISYIGTFTSVAPSQAMFDAGASIIRSISATYGVAIDSSNIKGHRDYSATACPGDTFYPKLPDLIALAATGGGGTTPANGTVQGVVFWGETMADYSTNLTDTSKRLAGATVVLTPGGHTATTGSGGSFSLIVPAGTYTAAASATGYQTTARPDPVTVPAGGTGWGSTMVLVGGGSGDVTAPVVIVTAPVSGTSTGTRTLLVQGTATDDVGVTSVTVAGAPATLTGTTFEATAYLSPGENQLAVVAQDAAGNQAVEVLTVTYTGTEPPGITGVVYNAALGPSYRIAGVAVHLSGTSELDLTTDGAGGFDVDLDPGEWTVQLSADGFSSNTRLVLVEAEGRARVSFGLAPLGAGGPVLLSLDTPLENELLAGKEMTVTGTATGDFALLTVNGARTDVVDGGFSVIVPAPTGDGLIAAAAWSPEGRLLEVERRRVRGTGCGAAGGGEALWAGLLVLGLGLRTARRRRA